MAVGAKAMVRLVEARQDGWRVLGTQMAMRRDEEVVKLGGRSVALQVLAGGLLEYVDKSPDAPPADPTRHTHGNGLPFPAYVHAFRPVLRF